MDFQQTLMAAATQGGGVILQPAPTFVSATGYVSAAADATTWVPFAALDLSNCSMAILIVGVDGASSPTSGRPGLDTGTTAGWTAGPSTVVGNSAMSARVFYTLAPTATDTVNLINNTSQQWSAFLIRLSGADSLATPVSLGASGSNPNPPAVNPGVLRNYFSIASVCIDGNTVTPSAGPSGYSNFTVQAASGSGGVSTSIATNTVTAGSEDPGVFTAGVCSYGAWTILAYKA